MSSRWRRRRASTRTGSRQTRPDYLRNRTVTDTYEPGSTFKLITVAGALSEGLVTPTSAFTLAPSIHVADRVIHEHDAASTVA